MPIQTSAPASNATGMAAEPVMPLPAGPMFAAATLGGIATIVLWFAGSALFESMQGVLPTALAGIGTVVAIYLATTAMLSPWKARRMGEHLLSTPWFALDDVQHRKPLLGDQRW